MAFTTIANVQPLLGNNYDGVTDLQQFIDAADVIMLRVQTCANFKGIPLSSVELEMIERWLSAHMYAQYDPLYQSKSTGQAHGSFQGSSGLSLDSTRYGQTAVALDYSGCLDAIGKRAVASAIWLGTDCSSPSSSGGAVNVTGGGGGVSPTG